MGHMMPKRNIAAFTLVELLMVVAIVSVMIGMVVSEFGANEATTADQALRLVSAQLTYVRELAVSNNSKYTVTLDKAKNRLVLAHTGADTNLDQLPESSFWRDLDTTDNQYFVFADLPLSWPVALKGADDTTEVTSIEFGPTGGTSEADDVDLWLSVGKAPPTYGSITILAGTGLIEVGDLSASAPSVLSSLKNGLPPPTTPNQVIRIIK
jgi:Tfp pilus assembly protein FimT